MGESVSAKRGAKGGGGFPQQELFLTKKQLRSPDSMKGKQKTMSDKHMIRGD